MPLISWLLHFTFSAHNCRWCLCISILRGRWVRSAWVLASISQWFQCRQIVNTCKVKKSLMKCKFLPFCGKKKSRRRDPTARGWYGPGGVRKAKEDESNMCVKGWGRHSASTWCWQALIETWRSTSDSAPHAALKELMTAHFLSSLLFSLGVKSLPSDYWPVTPDKPADWSVCVFTWIGHVYCPSEAQYLLVARSSSMWPDVRTTVTKIYNFLFGKLKMIYTITSHSSNNRAVHYLMKTNENWNHIRLNICSSFLSLYSSILYYVYLSFFISAVLYFYLFPPFYSHSHIGQLNPWPSNWHVLYPLSHRCHYHTQCSSSMARTSLKQAEVRWFIFPDPSGVCYHS